VETGVVVGLEYQAFVVGADVDDCAHDHEFARLYARSSVSHLGLCLSVRVFVVHLVVRVEVEAGSPLGP
jgi:hypothetical protein